MASAKILPACGSTGRKVPVSIARSWARAQPSAAAFVAKVLFFSSPRFGPGRRTGDRVSRSVFGCFPCRFPCHLRQICATT